MTLKDYLISFVFAFLVKVLVMKKIEDFVLTEKRPVLRQKRQSYERAISNPCMGPSNDRTGGAACANEKCFIMGGTEDLYCKTVPGDANSAILLKDQKTFLDEHAPDGWSTSQRLVYEAAFLTAVTLVCKFMLIVGIPSDIDNEYDAKEMVERE